MKKLVIAVVVLVVLGVGGVFGLEVYAQGEAERRVDAFLAQLPENATSSRGAVRYALWDNIVEIEDIALDFAYGEAASLKLARLVLVKPVQDADGVITVESFEATGAEMRVAAVTFDPPIMNIAAVPEAQVRVDSYQGRALRIQPDYFPAYRQFLALESPSFEDPAVMALLDPLMRGFDADELTAARYDGTVEVMMALPGEEATKMRYVVAAEDYLVRDLKNGRIGLYTSGPLSVDSVLGDPAAMESAMTVESTSVTGIDAGNMVKAYGPADPDTPGTFMPIIEEMTMTGIAYRASGEQLPEPVAVEIGRMSFTDYGLKSGLMALFDPDLENATPEQLTAFLEQLLGLYRIGGMEIEGLTAHKVASNQEGTQEGEQGEPGEPIFTMGRFVISDYEGARLGRIALENISAGIEDQGRFALAAFELGGLDYSGLLENWQVVAAGEPWPLGSLPRLDLVALTGLNVEAQGAAVTLEELRGESADYVQSVATRSTFLMKGLTVPLALVPDPNIAGMAELMELESVELSTSGGYRWDIAAQEARLEGFEIRLRDLGVLTFEMAIAGLGEGFIAAAHGDTAALAPEALSEVVLGGARLSYQDQSLLPRVFKAMAAASGQSEEEIKAGYGAQAEALAAALQDPAIIESVVAALKAFIAEPGQLVIALTPAEPVALVLIPSLSEAAPGELAKALNLTVQANP